VILCQVCQKLSPHESDFCIGCGGSFGGTRCSDGHLNHRSATSCNSCGGPIISKAVPSINLWWVTRVAIPLGLVVLSAAPALNAVVLAGHKVGTAVVSLICKGWFFLIDLTLTMLPVGFFLLAVLFLLGEYRSRIFPLRKIRYGLMRMKVWVLERWLARTQINLSRLALAASNREDV